MDRRLKMGVHIGLHPVDLPAGERAWRGSGRPSRLPVDLDLQQRRGAGDRVGGSVTVGVKIQPGGVQKPRETDGQVRRKRRADDILEGDERHGDSDHRFTPGGRWRAELTPAAWPSLPSSGCYVLQAL